MIAAALAAALADCNPAAGPGPWRLRDLERLLQRLPAGEPLTLLRLAAPGSTQTVTTLWWKALGGTGDGLNDILLSVEPEGRITFRGLSPAEFGRRLPALLALADDATLSDDDPWQRRLHAAAQRLAEAVIEATGATLAPARLAARLLPALRTSAVGPVAAWRRALAAPAIEAALALARSHGFDPLAVYSALVTPVPGRHASPAQIARNRSQFVAGRSRLAECWLAATAEQRRRPDWQAIEAAIDAGDSLHEHFTRTGLQAPRVRAWLLQPQPAWSGLSLGDVRIRIDLDGLLTLAAVLGEFPGEYWPDSPAATEACLRAIGHDLRGYGALARSYGGGSFPLLKALLRKVGWTGLADAVDASGRPLRPQVADALDAVQTVRDVLAARWPAATVALLLQRWLGERPLKAVLRLSAQIHTVIAAAQEELVRNFGPATRAMSTFLRVHQERLRTPWMPLLIDSPQLVDDVLFRELDCEMELLREGATMHHCVGTYADKCRRHELRVLHLQMGRTRATMAVDIRRWPYSVSELRGPRNALPGREIIAASAKFKRALKAGEIPCRHPDTIRLAPNRPKRTVQQPAVARQDRGSLLIEPLDIRLLAVLPGPCEAGTFAAELVRRHGG